MPTSHGSTAANTDPTLRARDHTSWSFATSADAYQGLGERLSEMRSL